MISTTNIFIWFFEGLGGIGGWFIFFILALLSILYVFVDSATRKLPALGWRLFVVLAMLLILPAGIFRFLPNETQATLVQYLEYIFYVGIIGGVAPLFASLGYFLQFRGMTVCPHGHVYQKELNECPECIPADFSSPLGSAEYSGSSLEDDETLLETMDEEDTGGADSATDMSTDGETGEMPGDTEGVTASDERELYDTEVGTISIPASHIPKSSAFLVLPGGQTCQLNKGTTTIGRGSRSDFILENEFVSRNHAKIVEEGSNLFRLYDLGSSNGTWLNGKKLLKATLLENDDEIQFGEELKVVFLSSRKL